jgi:tetratricopeptide (TPR) repeat protein
LELAREAPEDMSVQEYLGEAYYNLANTLSARGASAAAAAALESALALGRRQLQDDPTSKNSQGAVASYSRALSRRWLLDGDPARAAPLAVSSLAMYTALAAKEPLELRWQRGLAGSRLANAWIAIAQQDSSVARQHAEAASEVLAGLTRQHPQNETLYTLVADAEIMLGRLDAGDKGSTAESHWRAAIDALGVPKSNQRNPDILSRRAEALCWLGDVQGGMGLIGQLNDIGYRDSQYQQQIVASPCHQPRLTASRNR